MRHKVQVFANPTDSSSVQVVLQIEIQARKSHPKFDLPESW